MKKIYPAIVKDNNDPDKQHRIQIYVESFMHGWSSSDYPWARPARQGFGGSDSYGVCDIPEVDSKVWVCFENEDLMIHPFYLWDVSLENFNPGDALEQSSGYSTMGLSSSYPDNKYRILKNGVIIGASSGSSPEIYMYHPEGAYALIKSTGEIEIKDKTGNSSITLKSSGDVEIKTASSNLDIKSDSGNITLEAGTDTTEKMLLGETFWEKLKDWLDEEMIHTHATVFGPTSPMVSSAHYTTFKALESQTQSSKIKNN